VTARHVWLVVTLAALLRLILLPIASTWYDEATVGLTGLAVLRGQLPVYFFGQPFMGALGDAYMTAPAFFVLGASARSLELVAIALGVAWLGLVVRLAWEAFGPRAALFTALLWALPPNYLVHWLHESRPHYLLALALGTLALLLAFRVPAAAPRRGLYLAALLGLVVGLAFWVNFLSVVFWPSVALLVLRRGPSRALVGQTLAGAAAFVVGSLPHWIYGLQHGTAIPPAGGHMGRAQLLQYGGYFMKTSWGMLTGVPAGLAEGRAGTLLAVVLAVVYGAALVHAARRLRRGAGPAGAFGAGLLTLAVVNVAIAVGTPYGRFLVDDVRYLLPLYTALMPLLGWWLARLEPPRVSVAVAGGLLVVHLVGAAEGEYQFFVAPAKYRAELAMVAGEGRLIAALEAADLRRLYVADYGLRIVTFQSAERVIFSSHYEEANPAYALLVDGAERPAWWTGPRWPLLERNLDALGVRYTYRAPGAYVDFAVDPVPLHELDPARFVVRASEGGGSAAWIADRDIATLWSTPRPKGGGEWVEVDLGVTEPVALVRWLPGTYQEVPDGVRLEASTDGRAWRTLRELPNYFGPLYWSAGRPMGRVRSGRVELRVAPTPARYLRITQLGRSYGWHWTIRELFVYAATTAPSPPPDPRGADLVQALRAAGVSRLYADHGWGARVALADPSIRTPPANLALDPYGFPGAAEAFWPRVRWSAGAGALLEPADAESFAALARANGLGVTQRAVGSLVLFAYAPPPAAGSGEAPLPRASLTVTASTHPERGRLTVDGDPGTRWATARPQAPGDWVRVDLAEPRVVHAVRLWTANRTDSPRALALEGSEDGTTWRPIPAVRQTQGGLRWAGITALQEGVEGVRLTFAPVRLRALRLTLTAGDPVFDWSIHELSVFGGV
jgi:F5/8 type C domain-containing protein